jgi:hypothetical protein
VYDHLEPATRSGVLEVEPLLVVLPTGHSPTGLSDGPSDGGEMGRELGVPVEDVLPAFLGELDGAAAGIESRGQSSAIVSHQ